MPKATVLRLLKPDEERKTRKNPDRRQPKERRSPRTPAVNKSLALSTQEMALYYGAITTGFLTLFTAYACTILSLVK